MGSYFKFGKKIVKLPRKADESKYTAEELKAIPLDEVKKWIEAQIPNAFGKKKKEKPPAEKKEKKPVAKKTPSKKKK